MTKTFESTQIIKSKILRPQSAAIYHKHGVDNNHESLNKFKNTESEGFYYEESDNNTRPSTAPSLTDAVQLSKQKSEFSKKVS